MWGSTSRTNSWSATAWITTSVTATCPTSAPWTRGSTRTSGPLLAQFPHRGDRKAHRLLTRLQRYVGLHAAAWGGNRRRGGAPRDLRDRQDLAQPEAGQLRV